MEREYTLSELKEKADKAFEDVIQAGKIHRDFVNDAFRRYDMLLIDSPTFAAEIVENYNQTVNNAWERMTELDIEFENLKDKLNGKCIDD